METTVMDNFITNWEMNLENSLSTPAEEIATGPMEPYTLDREAINWN